MLVDCSLQQQQAAFAVAVCGCELAQDKKRAFSGTFSSVLSSHLSPLPLASPLSSRWQIAGAGSNDLPKHRRRDGQRTVDANTR